jgi:SAM-dependent methyltransferase
MEDHIVSGRSAAHRAASEALHSELAASDRHVANHRMLWKCGFADLIRDDFYALFQFSLGARGRLLDAGCGTGLEMSNFKKLAPGLALHGVDISGVALQHAMNHRGNNDVKFYQSGLEALPFGDGSYDYIASHEVIEHVEEPAIVLREFYRVLRPGGVAVIATPNGASVWVEHLRQRVARLFGRRGAPVGEDHVRPPSFWRREFARAGFVPERQIYDGAAVEFLTYVAPARWMPIAARLLEPLRTVPAVRLLLCDRVKFRLRKPGPPRDAGRGDSNLEPVCPVCHAASLAANEQGVVCQSGHRFARNSCGLIDFTAIRAPGDAKVESAKHPMQRAWTRRLRRWVLAAGCLVYVIFLAALLPLGLAVGRFYQPFHSRA